MCGGAESGIFRALVALANERPPNGSNATDPDTVGTGRNEEGVRCLRDAVVSNPSLEAPLRCWVRSYLHNGLDWLELCAAPAGEVMQPVTDSAPCSNDELLIVLLEHCRTMNMNP